MPLTSSYLLAGINPGLFVRLAARNGLGFSPRYLLRALFVLQSGMWTPLMAALERRAMRVMPRLNEPSQCDPIIVIGHWRTGTTLLHQLLSCDPGLAAPTLLHCTYPECILTGRGYIAPIMSRMVDTKRPMDNVRTGIDEPQEDEYALIRLSGFSPIEGLIFPRGRKYFLAGVEQAGYLPTGRNLDVWNDGLASLVAKVGMASGARRVVLKNPFHTMRVPALNALFPKARFVNIVRDPRRVVPSTVRMWGIVGAQNALRPGSVPPEIGEVCGVYGRMARQASSDLAMLSAGHTSQMRFEDLEQDPIESVRRIYDALDFPLTKEAELKMREFLGGVAGYRKNTYELSAADRGTIVERLGDLMDDYGYSRG